MKMGDIDIDRQKEEDRALVLPKDYNIKEQINHIINFLTCPINASHQHHTKEGKNKRTKARQEKGYRKVR